MRRILLPVIIFSLFYCTTADAFWFGGSEKQKTAYEYNKKAVDLANESKWDEALPLMEKSYKILSGNSSIRKNYVSILNGAALSHAEQKDWDYAVSRLEKANKISPGDQLIRKNLATIHNNYAIQLSGEGNKSAAKKHFLSALSYQGDNNNFKRSYANLLVQEGQANKKKYPDAALKNFRDAIEIDPRSAIAYAELGEIEYNKLNYSKALQAWQKAMSLSPELKRQLSERVKKLKTINTVEKDYRQYDRGVFRIRFKGYEREDVAWDLLNKLEYSYGRLAPILGYLHQNEYITVTIYTSDDFKSVTLTPDWAGGIYDGQIRLKIGDIEYGGDQLERLISHEFAHALIHNICKGKIPVWLNEGIAQYAETKNDVSAGEKKMLRDAINNNTFPSFSRLDKPFLEIKDANLVRLYYAMSKMFVRYIAEQYGEYSIKQLLVSLSKKDTLDDAFKEVFFLDLAGLENNWNFYLKGYLR